MVMYVDIGDVLASRIVHEAQPDCRDLPTGVTELPTNDQALRVAVEFEIADLDLCGAILDVNHRNVRRRNVAGLSIRHRMLCGGPRRRVKGSIAQPIRTAEPS